MPVFRIPAFGPAWIIAIVGILALSVIVEIIRNRNSDIDNIEETIEDRIVLRVSVPSNNTSTYANAEQLYAALHGFLQDRRKAFGHISLEIAASSYGIQFFVVTPPRFRKFVEGQIYAQYPHAEIDEIPDYTNGISVTDSVGITHVVAECELAKEFIFPIKTWKHTEHDTMNTLTSAMQGMDESDMLVYQLVIRPVNTHWQKVAKEYLQKVRKGFDPTKSHRGIKVVFTLLARIYDGIFSIRQLKVKPLIRLDENMQEQLSEISSKSDQSGYEGIIRILSASKSPEKAEENMQNIIAILRQFATVQLNAFSFHFPKGDDIPEAVTRFKTRFLSSEINDIYSTEELSTLFHFPNERVSTPSIAWVRARRSEAPLELPVEDCNIIGQTDFRGVTKKFGIKREDRRRHMYMIGKTGSGKTTLLKNLIMQDILNGEGVGVIDPHGDLIDDLLDVIPEDRMDDVVLVDPSDTEYPVSINPFSVSDEHQRDYIANSILSIFKKYFDSWGPRLEYILHNVILTLLYADDATMLSIQRILTDPSYRRSILENVNDPIILRFWNEEYSYMERNSRLIAETISPIQNKVGRFLAARAIRNMVGQAHSTIQFNEILDKKKILLCNLSQGKIGEESAALLGSLIVTQIQSAAMTRVKVLESERNDFYLYVDEFQLFTTDTFTKILSESRKYRLNLIIAHQYLRQIPEHVMVSILGNVGTIISFVVGSQDAKELEKEFFPVFTANDVISLENYAIYLKESIDGVISKPFSAHTLPFTYEDRGKRDEIIALSRKRYAASRDSVEESIRDWSMKSFNIYSKYTHRTTDASRKEKNEVKPEETLRLDTE